MKKIPRILIIDLSAILHAVKFSLGKNHKLSHQEKPTFVIYGFLLKLQLLIRKTRADVVVYATDSELSHRKKIYAQYKASRSQTKTEEQIALDAIAYPQFQEIIDYVIPTLGYRNVFGAAGFEADDVIGKICKDYKNEEIIICTCDQDMYQLLSQNICIIDARKNTYYSDRDFIKKYSIEPKLWKKVKSIGGCFDKKTEILTDRGWVFFPDIKITDRVYSMHPETREASYEKIIDIIKYRYTGDMYKIKGTLIDLLVTPDHKFFGSTQFYPSEKSKGIVRFKEIKDIVEHKDVMKHKKFMTPITSSWTGTHKNYFTLPAIGVSWKTNRKRKDNCAVRNFSEVKIKMDAWLAFLGIWLADGHIAKNRNNNIDIVGIAVCKERKLKYFKPILDRTPWKWTKSITGWKTDNRQLALYLQKLGKARDKYIPVEFLNLSGRQLQILFDALIAGDGCVCTKNYNMFGNTGTTTSISYYSSSKKLIDNVQEIAIKLGHATTIGFRKGRKREIKREKGVGIFSLKIRKSKNINLLKKEITKIAYDDLVYDITTEPHHTIFVRRNCNAVWSSNCSSDGVKGVPLLQTDSTKKQRHVAEKGALNFIKGTMGETTQAYKSIVSIEGIKTMIRNKKLVFLPFKGTPAFSIRPDHLKEAGLRRVCERYGFKSILGDMANWKKTLRLR